MRPWRELESLHCCDRARVSRCAPAWAQPVGDGLWGFGYLHITALSLVCRSLHGLNESLIAQKHLSFQLLPRRRRLDAFGHKACVASLRDGSAFGELSEQPGYCQARGPSNQAHACPVTTPLPLIRFLDHARAHRIEHHVTCKFQQIRVAVYQKESKGIGSGLGKESGQAWYIAQVLQYTKPDPVHSDVEAFGRRVDDNDPSPDIQHHIAWIDISGPSAAARVEFTGWRGFRFTDFFVLYKHDGQWKISGKVYNSHAKN